MKKILVIFALLAFTLVGCKDDDDSTGPSGEAISFPLAVGNYWNFNEYEYDADTDTQGDLVGTYRIDIVGNTTYKGKDAYQVVQSAEFESDTSYIAMEDGVLYTGGETYGTQADLVPDWIKLYDPNSTSWVTMDIDFSQDGISTKLKGNASNEGETTVSIGGESRSAVRIKQTIEMESSFTIAGQTQTQKQTIIQDYLFVNGIGFYQITSISDNILIDDSIEILVDYDVSN